jgi:hypothetical protein
MIAIRIIVLFLFLIFVENYPKLKPYSSDTKFNFYRSLMCMFFSLYSLDNTINNIGPGYAKPFDFKTNEFIDISEWFVAYLILDIGKMAWMKNTRWDLYVHHIWCLTTYGIAHHYGKIGFLANLVLVAESISIVSGVDAQFLEDKELDKSKACKVYRKNIIKYLRQPLWVFGLLITLYNAHSLPSVMFWNYILGSLLLIYLDRYWEKKCDKVINSE